MAAFASPAHDEPAVSHKPAVPYEPIVSAEPAVSYEPPVSDEPIVSYAPVVQQTRPEPVAAFAEDTFPAEPVREVDVSEPVEAPASVLEDGSL